MRPDTIEAEQATPRQTQYLSVLLQKSGHLLAEKDRERLSSDLSNGKLTKRIASQWIGWILRLKDSSSDPQQPVGPSRRQMILAAQQLISGVYMLNGDLYRVRHNRRTITVGKIIFNGSGKPFHRNPGGDLNRLGYDLATKGGFITLQRARQLGLQTGWCMICGRKLTDHESVAKGIGPVCEQNYPNLAAKFIAAQAAARAIQP